MGLEAFHWTSVIKKICGPEYAIKHQSHYTSILRLASVEVLSEPKLMGPMTTCYLHEKRTCQHVRVKVRGSAEKPTNADRNSVVQGYSGDLGGRRINKKESEQDIKRVNEI